MMDSTAEMTSLNDWVNLLFQHRDLLRMGHAQRFDDQNLGLGWLYYALGRVLRPSEVVVIGSFRGFVPLVIARALSDNSEPGHVHFIDPSFVDDFWKQDAQVQEYFSGFGITNVTHHLMTTQQFVESDTYREFQEIGLVFIDGYHSAEQAQFDFESFAPKLAPQGIILLHDSLWGTRSKIYGPGREYTHSVMNFVAKLRHLAEWQVFDFPFGDGVTLVRGATVPLLAERTQ
jgi:predicted O-methyltransferase YrrM